MPKRDVTKSVLIALLPQKSDLVILMEQGWYRIPTASAPKRWPPAYLAFYQPKIFGKESYQIKYFGRIEKITEVSRRDLFPDEPINPKSDKPYFRLSLKSLEQRDPAIPSYRPRRIVFIPTTWGKFMLAEQINDLFDDSPLEDLLWRELKKQTILAERQWHVKVEQSYYQLDFAFFCNRGKIDVEADGNRYHLQPERVIADNQRNNDLASDGWHVLRFNTAQIKEQRGTYCLSRIVETINRLGGLDDDGIIPREFYTQQGHSQQLSLFNEKYQDNPDPTITEFD